MVMLESMLPTALQGQLRYPLSNRFIVLRLIPILPSQPMLGRASSEAINDLVHVSNAESRANRFRSPAPPLRPGLRGHQLSPKAHHQRGSTS